MAGDDAEICEIAAAEGKNTFQVYILPSNSITPAASAVNKLTVRSRVLHYDGQPVSSTSLVAGLSDLLQWLEARQPCLLIAHNAKAFDAKHLVKAVTSSDLLPKFSQVVLGFSDTLPAFRQLFPDRASCSQEHLAQDLLEKTYNAHSALDDVLILQELASKYITDSTLLQHSFTTSWVETYTVFLGQKKQNLKTLQPLISSKAVSKGMAEKIAASGLRLSHIQLAFTRGGADGISKVLTEKFSGRARITTNKRILESISSFFADK